MDRGHKRLALLIFIRGYFDEVNKENQAKSYGCAVSANKARFPARSAIRVGRVVFIIWRIGQK